jgi:hypothetical protein
MIFVVRVNIQVDSDSSAVELLFVHSVDSGIGLWLRSVGLNGEKHKKIRYPLLTPGEYGKATHHETETS